MAWHSSGQSNDELVDKLIENNQISSSVTAEAFRRVDRVHFVPKGTEDHAYSDRPLKEGNVHISAPHIYCTVVESLELEENSNVSFLNIGSGTGYLSCIVGQILGPGSQLFGVEIYDDVLQHCRAAITSWKGTRSLDQISKFDFYQGNGFEISQDEGESRIGYDRIYVGAQISADDNLNKIRSLLSPGGILVAPVDDCLVKITRTEFRTSKVRDNRGDEDLDFITEEITGVHFAPLMTHPSKEVVIPATKWCPSNHRNYPKRFQDSIRAVLLCSSSSYIQKAPVAQGINVSAALPRDLWVHIFSFANRKWFEPENGEAAVLRRRLRQEQRNAAEARTEVDELQVRLSLIQRERDLYLSMIRRWRSEIRHSLSQAENQRQTSRSTNNSGSTRNDNADEDSLYLSNQVLLNEANAILSGYFMRGQLINVTEAMEDGGGSEDNSIADANVLPVNQHNNSNDDDDDSDDESFMDHDSMSSETMDVDLSHDHPRARWHRGDVNDDNILMLGTNHGGRNEEDSQQAQMEVSGSHDEIITAMNNSHHHVMVRPQIRSVSITNEDL